ncbi:heme uptake protein IsdC [Paenibacillus sp. UNCCL117]|uniref:heme uptake protein IsdC n=1 Tax=unclassified Paenibacillus TaxID=185978 RepID=UPI000881D1C3|nr:MULTISPECIES: heme uptake protein IsdC [unclassified Paenibacillus]SDE60603.1 heme uptake protein IsdC [Paenibacillus sp. cl123]SFW69580.1 heme uptake protein IsdC [Paenibacillus sp. UNCCL117]
MLFWKKKLRESMLAFSLLVAVQALELWTVPSGQAASALADGTHTVSYVITKAENDSVSMANDYFEKPAALTVKNGDITARIQLNHSKWITVFKTAAGGEFSDAKVVGSDKDEDTRIVQFKIEDLSKPLLSKIHVTVPDIDYDHDYTIRFVFDQKTLKSTGAALAEKQTGEGAKSGSGVNAAAQGTKPEGAAAAVKKPAAAEASTVAGSGSEKSQAGAQSSSGGPPAAAAALNPATGDEAPLATLFGLLSASGLYIAYRLRKGH